MWRPVLIPQDHSIVVEQEVAAVNLVAIVAVYVADRRDVGSTMALVGPETGVTPACLEVQVERNYHTAKLDNEFPRCVETPQFGD
jgi:hypothetical protein